MRGQDRGDRVFAAEVPQIPLDVIVYPGPFGLCRRAAYPPAQPGGLAQFAEQPLPLGLGP